ncbi:MAG TPA: hypothetical protein VF533_18620 [Solirubrobacteraceae bacterium]|jgi:hypothetical protein
MTPATAEVICILGMHRSGTSCLAGSLQEAGLYLGEVNVEAPHNAKGNRENEAIQKLNEALLVDNGGYWRRPPEVVRWSPERRAQRDEIIASYGDRPRWGFKDPRTVFTLSGWREALPAMRYVASYRHPLAAAASVQARGNWKPEAALALWLTYNRRLLRLHSLLGFPLISFDAPPDAYEARLRALCEDLGLTPPGGGFAFFEQTLRSQSAPPDGELPAEIAAAYDELRRAAGDA